MTDSVETDYVRRLLQMNPLEQPDEILMQRRNFLEPETDGGLLLDHSLSAYERKEQILKTMEALRKGLWKLDEDILREQVAAIDVTEFPDLAISYARLKEVADHRDSFRRLKEHPLCFPEFFNQFCSLVASPPQKTTRRRAECMEASRKGSFDTQNRSPRDYYLIAQAIQRELPELYELEKPWLSHILSKRDSVKIFDSSETIMAILALVVMLCFYFVSKLIFQ